MSRGQLVMIAGIALLAAVIIFQITALSIQVVGHLNRLQSAGSDNTQWTLSQAEVEFLEFAHAVDLSSEAAEPDLDSVRREFDIFYSRIRTISSSPLYAGLQALSAFQEPLSETQAFLNASVERIDGSDTDLIAGLGALQTEIWGLRPTIRTLASSGLSYFARQSDEGRRAIASTLFWLAAISLLLFAALAWLAVYLGVINRRLSRRGADLSQANQRMNTILSTSLDGVIVSDAEGRVVEFNEAAETIFGYTAEDAKGRRIGELIVPPALREAHNAGIERMKASGERRVVGRGRVTLDAMRAGGEIFPVEMALQRAQDHDTEIVIGFLRDISQRVASEEELVLARDRAVAGEKAKADFLAVMSHEIRTPLNGVLGNLTLMEQTKLSRRQFEYVRNMKISGRILMGHVDAVLDIAKYEAGKLQINAEPVGLSQLLQDIVDAQSGAAEAQGTVIEWNWLGQPMDWAKTDAARLQQILLNLVGNAIKFTEQGRITIEAEVLRAPVQEDDAKRWVEIRVIDTGVGIPPEDLQLVFDDFETRDVSFGRATGGTGLGLSIARRMTEALGGEIGAESEPGSGSLFWVRLPLDPADPPRKDVRSAPDREGLRQLNVLVVEDNEINLELARNMLELDGHAVTSAMNGQSGIEKAGQTRFDLILMDISMPVMDGVEATRAIRAGNGPSADAPIVALSANVLPQDIDRFRAAGMNDFLGKPLGLDDLRRILSDIRDGKGQYVPPSEGAGLIDSQKLRETRDSLTSAAFDRLLSRFVTESDELLSWLNGLDLSSHPLPDVAERCHKVAGSAAVFGARDFRAGLVELENHANAGDTAKSELSIKRLSSLWPETRDKLTTV
ncbi:PAS domain S-box protein [Seohaeicola saemankumensis]|nr:PAS domain-containing hybrid sensor histidine kinase/response regulator [Seohaeicola saemankumensis]MCA0872927.1 PAS domain S-box protein [Seohaeicola saemankumensis]